eukprot:4248547-Pleurochrysis_carterae.AAC.1
MHCVNAMATATALRRILAADHAVAECVTQLLVEGLVGQQKRRDVAVFVGRALKFFLRAIGDH